MQKTVAIAGQVLECAIVAQKQTQQLHSDVEDALREQVLAAQSKTQEEASRL